MKDFCARPVRSVSILPGGSRPVRGAFVARLALVALSVSLPSCAASSGDEEAPPAGPTWAADVAPILQENCVECHQEGGIAPFVLTSYSAARDLAVSIAESARARTMPPWGLDNSGTCNTWRGARWLGEDEIATLEAWADAGAPEGDPADAPVQSIEDDGLVEVDAVLEPAEPYTPNSDAADDYRCFILENPYPSDAYMTGYQVRPGAPSIVHHVLLYELVDEESVEEAEALDADDEGPGYTCYGSPRVSSYNLLAAWAPGSPFTYFPENTGIFLPSQQKMVVQIHYNLDAGAETDLTAIDLQLEDDVSKEGMMFITGDTDMVLPARREDASTLFDIPLRDYGVYSNLTLYGLFPHMHRRGTHAEVSWTGADESHCVADLPRWDFNWQRLYFFDTPLRLEMNDLLRMTCSYDTMDSDTLVPWGDGTEDEMCVIAFYFTLQDDDSAVSPADAGVVVPELEGVDAFNPPVTTEWASSFGSLQYDNVRDIAVDRDGDIYIVGYTESSLLDMGEDITVFPGGGDGYLSRIAPDGSPRWTIPFGGTGRDGLNALAIDGDTILVVGYTGSDEIVLGDATFSSLGDRDVFAARVDRDGTVLWGTRFGSSERDEGRSIAAGPDGRIVIAGSYRGTMTLGGEEIDGTEGVENGFLAVLDSSAALEWAQTCRSSSLCAYRDVVVDEEGHIDAVGYFRDAADFGAGTIASAGDLDGFIVSHALDSGALRWWDHFGDLEYDYFRTLTAAPGGGVVAAGRFTGNVSFDSHDLAFSGGRDGLLVRYDDDGTALWARSIGGIAGENISAVQVDEEGRTYFAAYYDASSQIDDVILTNAGSADVLVGAYAPDGRFIGVQRFGGRSGDWNPSLALTPDHRMALAWYGFGPVQVGGSTLGNVGNADIILSTQRLETEE